MGNVIKADWSFDESKSGYKKPIKISAKASKRAATRARNKLLRLARYQAIKVVGNLCSRGTREIANGLVAMGKISGGPYGKAGARNALIEWYQSIPTADRGVKKVKKVDYKGKLDIPFYESREWRALRYKALIQHGRQCQCCGAKPPQIILHVDHIKPRSIHPELELDIDNLQILCEDCNLGKSNKDDTDFRL